MSNVTEWCKKEYCWTRLQKKLPELENALTNEFKEELVPRSEIVEAEKTARKTQKMDNGIEAQRKVVEISGPKWHKLSQQGEKAGLLSPKELGILRTATQIPRKIPSDKQSIILIELLERLEQEGIVV